MAEALRKTSSYVPSSGSRLWAHIIDNIIHFILLTPVLGWPSDASYWDSLLFMSWGTVFFVITVPLLYDGLLVWWLGTTFGKWICGLRVASYSNLEEAPGFWASMTRALASRLEFFLSWAPFVTMFLRHDRVHVIDRIAETRVVAAMPPTEVVFKQVRPKFVLVFGVLFVLFGFFRSSQFMASMEMTRQGISFIGPVQSGQ